MSSDLHTQLLDYGRYHDEQQRPVTVEEVRGGNATVVPVEFDEGRRLQGPWAAVVAGATILIMVGALAWLAGGGSGTVVDQPTTTVADTVPGDPMAVVDAFFASFNEGDHEAVMALFTDDANFSTNLTPSMSREEWEQVLAWDLAQGTVLTGDACISSGEEAVVCEREILRSLERAVGAPPVTLVTTLVITEDGIIGIHDQFPRNWWGPPSYGRLVPGFHAYTFAHHPDDSWSVLGWASIEDARAKGEIIARYADEWAAFLEAKNCTYPSDCFWQHPATGGG